MTPDPFLTVAILAGGAARRLGRIDKGALVVGTSSILDRQLSVVGGLTPHILIVVSDRSRVQPLPASAGQRGEIRVAVDRVAGAGALGGLYTALMDAPTDQVLVIGCDMPFLTAPFLSYLAECGRNVDAAVPRDERGRHPLCASYARRRAGHFLTRIQTGDLRVGEALRDLTVRELGPDELTPFDRDGRLLLNINTPDDYTRARLAVTDDADDDTQPPPHRARVRGGDPGSGRTRAPAAPAPRDGRRDGEPDPQTTRSSSRTD